MPNKIKHNNTIINTAQVGGGGGGDGCPAQVNRAKSGNTKMGNIHQNQEVPRFDYRAL